MAIATIGSPGRAACCLASLSPNLSVWRGVCLTQGHSSEQEPVLWPLTGAQIQLCFVSQATFHIGWS